MIALITLANGSISKENFLSQNYGENFSIEEQRLGHFINCIAQGDIFNFFNAFFRIFW